MTNPSFNPDDPRLTAFVLGELDDVDRDAVEQLLETSPEARAFVDDLQDTIGVLRDELSSEPAPALTDEQRASLQAAANDSGDQTVSAATRPAGQSHRRSRGGLLAGIVATVAALGIVVALLPQVAHQRMTAMSQSDSTITLANKESLVASASSRAPFNEAADARILRDSPAEAMASGLSSRNAPKDGTASEAHYPGIRDLVSEAGKVTVQLKDEKADTDRNSGGSPVAVADQSEESRSSAPVSRLYTDSRRRTPQNASGAAGSVDGEQLAKGRLLSSDHSAPFTPGQSTAMRSGLANQTTPVSAQPVSAPAIVAGREAAAAVPETAPRATGQTTLRLSSEPRSVSSPVTMPVKPVATRGLSSQTLVAKGADQAPASPADGRAVTVAGDALKESELSEAIRARRVVVPNVALPNRVNFLAPKQDRPALGRRRLDYRAENEAYEPIVENEFVVPDPKDADKRLSTISVDVDTASYANVRRFLMQDQLPPANAVRIEELVNYFKYDYPQPKGDDPFSVTTEIMLCPWQPGHRLARIGLQAKTIDKSQRPPTNLVFLLDVSGSMRPANKLPLVQQAMRLLVEEMTEDDQIAIVTYASNAGLRLVSTPGSKKTEILQSIDSLTAGGSTNGEGGIKLAYDTAIRHYIQDGANRVILCTDGDFNVGISNDNELVELIQEKAASGVFLSVFGFGMGNLKDGKLEKLADKGNGQYGYIDNLQEARRAFSEDLAGTLYTVAKDVKLQAEFNPATVGAYRLIGYENRKLAAADFTDDTKDAGEIGAGHTVTALYEIVPRQVLVDRLNSDEFRYTGTFDVPAEAPKVDGFSDELFFVRLRYKQPDQETSEEVPADFPVNDIVISGKPVAAPSADFQFAAAVASFGMNLRNSQYRGNWDLRHVYNAAVQTRGEDADGRRAEFVDLIQRTMRIAGQQLGIDLEKLPVSERPAELSAAEARIKAAVDGKYRRLLKKIEVRDDLQQYGAFHDFGFWDKSSEYKGHSDLLPGYWVYVYPNWYIWGEADASRLPKPESKPGDASAASTPDAKEKTDAPVPAEKQ